MSSPVSIHPDALIALSGELRAVASGLTGAGDPCRAAAAALGGALEGEVGSRAAVVATAWAALTGLLARQCDAVAGTLAAAVESYADTETVLSGTIEQQRMPYGGPR